jgi:DNA-binding transcriptional regulator YhcF (GntR family)
MAAMQVQRKRGEGLRPAQAFDALWAWTLAHGYQPSTRELAVVLECSAKTVHYLLVRLAEAGYIEQAGRRRAVVLLRTPQGRPFRGLKHAG